MDELEGVTEADKVYIDKGNKQSNRKARKKRFKKKGRGTWESDKPPVIGVVERESGEIRLEVYHDATKQTCEEVISEHVEVGSIVYTDERGGYNGLSDMGYMHKTVCHSMNEYARDDDWDGICEVHTNTAEGIWSLLRQTIRTFKGVSKKYLYLYVHAFEFFQNLKKRVEDPPLGLLTVLLLPHRNRT